MPSTIRLHQAVLAAALLVPAAVFAMAGWWNRTEVLRERTETLARMTAVMHEHAAKVFDTADLVLARVEDHIHGRDPADVAASETSEFLRAVKAPLDQLVSIWIVDASGTVRAGSQPWGSTTSIADRDFFRVHREAENAGTYVSAAFTGRATTTASFAISRRRVDPQGRFAGTIHVALSPEYFARFFAEAAPSFVNAAALFRTDGEILARHPTPSGPAVQRLGPASPVMRSVTLHPDGALLTGISTFDGRERVYSYQRVGSWPVYVGAGADVEAVLARWHANLRLYGAVAAVAALTLLLVSWLALHRARAEQVALVRASDEVERRLLAEQRLREEAERRLEAEGRLRQAQKLEAVGQLTGGIAHDFNNHLAVIVGSLQLLRRRMERGEANVSRYLDAAVEAADRAARLTSRLLAFARRQPLDPRPLQANDLIAGMTELLRRTLGERIAVVTVLKEGLWRTRADGSELENAILNLAVNARDAMPEGGTLTIRTANHQAEEPGSVRRDYVVISVTDSGVGMPPDVVAKVFEPFFTTKGEGHGTGLGLSQVYGFVTQSGGRVEIDSAPGRGTTVRILLPRDISAATEEHAGPSSVAVSLPVGAAPVVLVVEDEDRVRRFAVEALHELGYSTINADRPSMALRLLREQPEIGVLFTDVVMPEMDGRRLAEEALRLRPDLKVVFTTGYPREVELVAPVAGDALRLVPKPYTLEALADAMAGATGLRRAAEPPQPAP